MNVTHTRVCDSVCVTIRRLVLAARYARHWAADGSGDMPVLHMLYASKIDVERVRPVCLRFERRRGR